MRTVYNQQDHIPEFVQSAQVLEKLFYEDQLVLFQKRTSVFMQESFPGLSATLTEVEIENLAIAVMKQAECWSYVSEQEIWQYLIVVVYCGFFFDTDPQYADFLHTVGWNRQATNRSRIINRLLDMVDEFYVTCERDFENFGRKLKCIVQFYMGWNYNVSLTDNMRITILEKVLQEVFSARWALLLPSTRQFMLSTNLKHADSLGFSVRDGIIYTLAAVYFGQAFERSPVYPWAHFLGDTNIPATLRVEQFIEAVQNHFCKLVI